MGTMNSILTRFLPLNGICQGSRHKRTFLPALLFCCFTARIGKRMKTKSALVYLPGILLSPLAAAVQVQVQYTYDDINRLTAVTFDSVPLVGYNYDAAGNILSVTADPSATASAPGAPAMLGAVAGDAQAIVSFTAPANTGSSAISSYTATSSPGNITATGTSSPITVNGLANGTAYTFTVTATNASLTGPASAPSSPVTPVALVPAASLTPISLSFTSQAQGTSSTSQSVTFSNVGTATLSIGSIIANGDFSQANSCGSSLAASGHCSISVTFTPSAAGNRTGNLTITDNTATSPHFVYLSGIGQASVGEPLTASLVPGWNLLGNGTAGAIDVASVFGDANKITSVWKWLPGAQPGWAFYSPSQMDGGAAYAVGKGYSFLNTINSGEGFWVNAKQAFNLSLGSGRSFATSALQDGTGAAGANPLPHGWSLIAVGDNPTPQAFANGIAMTPPAAGNLAATSITTLWAWYPGSGVHLPGWLFYSPTLDNSAGLANYISNQGYLDFNTLGKTLDPSTGFWVNHP